jgi:hypothetical protein
MASEPSSPWLINGCGHVEWVQLWHQMTVKKLGPMNKDITKRTVSSKTVLVM